MAEAGSPRSRRRWPAVVVLVVGACGGGDDGAAPAPSTSTTAVDPSTTAPTGPPSTVRTADAVHDPDEFPVPDGAVVPEGFDRVSAVVTTADGRECRLCLWLADEGNRSLGLKFVDDIGPADGMAFVYPEPDQRTFTMDGVRIDLDIAFFDADGVYMSDFPMAACPLGDCPRYDTPSGITVALEVRPGSLPDLGIGPGSSIALTDLPCP